MADKCKPGNESVSPRQIIYEGTAKERNAQAAKRNKNLKDSKKIFDIEQKQYEALVSSPSLGFVEQQHQVMFCFPGDTLVLSEDGWKEIREIREGEKVLSGNSNESDFVRVSGLSKRKYRGYSYEIKGQGLLPIVPTGNHKIPVRHRAGILHSSSDYEKVKLGGYSLLTAEKIWSISEKNKLLSREYSHAAAWRHSEKLSIGMPIDRVTIDVKELTPDKIKILGSYVAEGSISGGTVTWCLGATERRWAKQICKLVSKEFGKKASIKKYNKSTLWVRCSSVEVVRFIRKYVLGKRAREKSLTQSLMRLPVKKQEYLLSWMYEGDGCYPAYSESIYTTASKVLALQVQQIHLRAGRFVSITHNIRKKNFVRPDGSVCKSKGKSIYHVWLRSSSRVQWDGDVVWVPVVRINRKKHEGDVYTLVNVGRWHTYTTQGGLVGNCDFIIFVAGVDVSPWVAGSLTVTLSSRDGQNTASFNLQNSNDNFVLTLKNISDPDNKAGGWRDGDPLHLGSQYSERAKYQIFKKKNAEFDNCFFPNNPYDRYIGIFRDKGCAVPANLTRNTNDVPGNAPLPADAPPATSGFVRSARQWPLDPHRPVFHKHDPVRIFIHNPTTEGDWWLPGFTGFISSYSFNDDYVTGESQITINCYDIRGVMEKMRVAKNIKSSLGGGGGGGNVNALVELVDGSMNTGFFKDLLVESSWTSFVAGKSLLSVAQFLVTGKGFSDPSGQEGTVLTPQFRSDMSSEDIERFKATGAGYAQPLTIGPTQGVALFTRQNDASGVGTFRMGLYRELSQRVQCDPNGFQEQNLTLEEWYNILLFGVRRSPTTGDMVGRDGLPIQQPDAKSCLVDANVVNQAIAEGNLIAGFNDLAVNPGDLPAATEHMLVRNAVELIELSPEQQQAFDSSTEGSKINNEIIQLQKDLLAFDEQLEKDKVRLDQLRNQPKQIESTGVAGSFNASTSQGELANAARDREITDLLTKISSAPETRKSRFIDRDQKLRNELNLAKAKFKKDHPSQDPKSSTSNAVQLSKTDKTPVPRVTAFKLKEVMAIGAATTWKGGWSPWNGLLHYLGSGEGNIKSLLDISYQEQFDNSEIDWETRSGILSELAQKLDYQWWVTPLGDIVFEFPMYDFFPTAFGEFATLMSFDHHLKSADFTDESESIPTVFIGQGSYSTFAKYQEGAGQNNNEWANRVILFAPTLASRIGVVVEKETFPSFVGDTPAHPLPSEAASIQKNIPTSQEIADYLDKVRAGLQEPRWIRDQRDWLERVRTQGVGSVDPAAIAFWSDAIYKIDKVEGNYNTAANRAGQGTTEQSLKGRQLILAQSVADNSAGLPGRFSQGRANQNIADTVQGIIKSMSSVTTGDVTDSTGNVIRKGPRAFSDAQLQEFQDYLIKAYSIPTDFAKTSAATDNITSKTAQVERREHIRNWSILDFQRRLANAAVFDQQNEYRPFVLPNKPIYCVPRQRVGMSTTITHTMEINHICSTNIGVTNMKHLTVLQDGSLDFTHIAGAKNSAVDYTRNLFSKTNGIVPLDEALAPIASTPETASMFTAPTYTEKVDKASSVAGHTQPTSLEEAAGESSIANRFKNPDPVLDQQISSGVSGIVTFAGYFDDVNGLTVMVDIGDGTRMIIPNLNKVMVDVGKGISSTTVVGTRPPGIVYQSIMVDCSNKSKVVPSALPGVLTSSKARNPPPQRSTVADSANNSFVNKSNAPQTEIRSTPEMVSTSVPASPPVSEEIMSSSIPISSSK